MTSPSQTLMMLSGRIALCPFSAAESTQKYAQFPVAVSGNPSGYPVFGGVCVQPDSEHTDGQRVHL